MCFFLRGANLGKELRIQYEIMGDSSENVKFFVRDLDTNDKILQLRNHEGKNQIHVN